MKRLEKSTLPRMRPSGGMMMSLTSDVTILPKAAPMMTPMARSTTLPRMANSRNSRSMTNPRALLPAPSSRQGRRTRKRRESSVVHPSGLQQVADRQPCADGSQDQPKRDNHRRRHTRACPTRDAPGRGAMLRHDLGRDQLNGKDDAERDDNEIVEQAEHRDKIGNEVEGRKRVARNSGSKGFCVPRDARVTCRQVKGARISLDTARPLPHPTDRDPSSKAASRSIATHGRDSAATARSVLRPSGD